MAIKPSSKTSQENADKNNTNLYFFDIIFTLFIINIFIASLNNIKKRREEKSYYFFMGKAPWNESPCCENDHFEVKNESKKTLLVKDNEKLTNNNDIIEKNFIKRIRSEIILF